MAKKKKSGNAVEIILFSILGITLVTVIIISAISKPKKYQVSNLKIKDNHIVGTFKNNSNKDCNDVKIEVKLKSGSFEEDETLYLDSVEIDEIKEIDDYCLKCDNLDENDIEVKVVEIKCDED